VLRAVRQSVAHTETEYRLVAGHCATGRAVQMPDTEWLRSEILETCVITPVASASDMLFLQ
jgi:hypothetical protein